MKQIAILAAIGSMALTMKVVQAFLGPSPLLMRGVSRVVRLQATGCFCSLGNEGVSAMKGTPDRDDDGAPFLKEREQATHATRHGWIQVSIVFSWR